MAINLITQPSGTVPIDGTDYTQQNLLINAALAQGDEVLTDWAESTAAPAIKQGVYFYHSGNSYQVQDNDASITGTPVSGANYIGLTESSGVLTAEYVTDISGYTWNPAYNGLYNGSTLIIRALTYLIGSAYHRALGADKAQSGIITSSNGYILSSSGGLNFGSSSVETTGAATFGSVNGAKTVTYKPSYTSGDYDISTGIPADNVLSISVFRQTRSSGTLLSYHDTWSMQSYGLFSIAAGKVDANNTPVITITYLV